MTYFNWFNYVDVCVGVCCGGVCGVLVCVDVCVGISVSCFVWLCCVCAVVFRVGVFRLLFC